MTTEVECPQCGERLPQPGPKGLTNWNGRHKCKPISVRTLRRVLGEEIRANVRDTISPGSTGTSVL